MEVVFPADWSLVLTHCTISFSMMGFPVLASLVRIDNVYALINCHINAEKISYYSIALSNNKFKCFSNIYQEST